MSRVSQPCGLFGKLPQQPDFISHNLPAGFTDALHHWLQNVIASSAEQLGEHWLDLYLTSPVWHFAMDGGVCGEQAAAGVMIPSVDGVGRYFPLVLAHCDQHRPWCAWLTGEEWYMSAEQILLSVLAEDVSYDQLVAMLDGLGSPEFRGSPSYQIDHYAVALPLCLSVELGGPGSRAGTVLGLAEAVSRQLSGGHSLWWTSGSQRVGPVLLICTGLPDPGRFAAMLDGQWQQQGWSVPLVCEESASHE